LLERPIPDALKSSERASGAERLDDARLGRDSAPSGDRRSPDASDSIWDPEVKAKDEGRHEGLLARLPRGPSEARSSAHVRIDTPVPVLRQLQSPPLSDGRFAHPLPQRARRRSWSGMFWFVVCVVLPTAAAAIYYGRVASDQYVAEFRFTVKDASVQSSSSAAASTGLLAILGSAGNTTNNSYVVVDYLKSRQVVDTLQERIDVTRLYSKPSVDWWSRYDASRPIESFVNYWRGTITANYNQVTGIATAKVRAFTPDDTLLVATTLVTLSEELVNKIANRSHIDAVRFAQAEVDKAEQRLKQVRERLTNYRNRTGLIDPSTSVVASSANLIQSLRATLAQQEVQLSTMLRQNLLPTAPTVVVLRNQIQSTREQLKQVEASVAKNPDGRPLSTVMGEYEQIDLERQFAQTMLTGAGQALEQARANAAAQHLYITPYVRPSLPTASTYPHRFWSVLYVGGLAFVFWVIALMIVRSIRERYA